MHNLLFLFLACASAEQQRVNFNVCIEVSWVLAVAISIFEGRNFMLKKECICMHGYELG